MLALLSLCPAWPSTAAAAPRDDGGQIAMSEAQIRQAGIVLATVNAPASGQAAAGGALVLSGTVVPTADALAVAAAPVPGVVQQVHAETLQAVRAGTLLATLFSAPWMELQRDYVQLAMQARLAASRLARDESLFADGIIARGRLDESRAAAQLAALAAGQRAQALRAGGMGSAAIAALANGGALHSQLQVRAPASGVILELPLAVGQQAEAGIPLARLVRHDALLVELQATERQLQQLSVGDVLQVPACGQLKVEAIGPALQGSNQTARVRARPLAAGTCFRINAFVEAHLAQPRIPAGAQLVPANALVRRGAQQYVFVRSPLGFRAVAVSSGSAGAGQAWIKGALPSGVQVATRGLVALKGAWAGLGEAGAAGGQGEH